jgi:hypothetical protein
VNRVVYVIKQSNQSRAVNKGELNMFQGVFHFQHAHPLLSHDILNVHRPSDVVEVQSNTQSYQIRTHNNGKSTQR